MSGLMSGDGRRDDAKWPSYRAHPRLYRKHERGRPKAAPLATAASGNRQDFPIPRGNGLLTVAAKFTQQSGPEILNHQNAQFASSQK
jgi:hypothetical protein